jgi:amidase
VANEQRARLSHVIADTFNRMDAIIAPCAPVAAFRHDHGPLPLRSLTHSDGTRHAYLSLLDWSALPIVCGLPATAIPIGQTPEGLPVGIQVIGPKGSDSRILAIAEAIELALGGFRPPPPVQP